MNLFSKLFNRKEISTKVPAIPPFSEVIEMMYDKSLSFSDDLQVIKVIYNKEKTKRFILLKNTNGYYKYTYEELHVCNEAPFPMWLQ